MGSGCLRHATAATRLSGDGTEDDLRRTGRVRGCCCSGGPVKAVMVRVYGVASWYLGIWMGIAMAFRIDVIYHGSEEC
jgi:hypothetical protein